MFDNMYGFKLDFVGHLHGWNSQTMKVQFRTDYKEKLEPAKRKTLNSGSEEWKIQSLWAYSRWKFVDNTRTKH